MKHAERLNGVEITLVGCVYRIADRTKRELNRDIIIIDTLRSSEEQARKYAQGRTTPGAIITNAQAGSSPHEYACGVDLWIMSDDGTKIDWNNQEFHAILKEEAVNQIEWGGNFHSIKDYDHIEYKDWRNVRAGVKKIITHTIENSLADKVKPVDGEAKNGKALF